MKTTHRYLIIVIAALLLLGSGQTLLAQTSTQTVALEPGSNLNVTCRTGLLAQVAKDRKSAVIKCAAISATATKTKTAVLPSKTATKTSVPPTATKTKTPVPPTATQVPPTSTPLVIPSNTPAASGGLNPVDAEILGTCPAAVHDRYVVAGPDGKPYRTWHPVSVPIDPSDASKGTCSFAHEHGDDPTKSLANPSLPPFDYIGTIAGHLEAHQGFKVAVANKGEVNDEGRVALGSGRVVFHMGTGGPKRFTEGHHMAMIDVVMPSGQYVHVQGIFDTANAGSICERDRNSNDGDPNNDIGRAVVTLPGTGCDVNSLYEIWAGTFNVKRSDGSVAATLFSIMSVFDPVTVMDPADRTRLVYTKDAFASRANEAPFMPPFRGCDREAYVTAPYWYNPNGPTVYFTDAFGNPGGPLRQEISQHNQIGIDMAQRSDGNLNQFKFRRDYCAPSIGLKN
jgi:hypothetical protein